MLTGDKMHSTNSAGARDRDRPSLACLGNRKCLICHLVKSSVTVPPIRAPGTVQLRALLCAFCKKYPWQPSTLPSDHLLCAQSLYTLPLPLDPGI